MHLSEISSLFSLLYHNIRSNRDHLNDLDSQIGDGDHGYTMERAFQAAMQAAQESFTDIGTAFDACAEALAENAGGAIGPLLAAFFAEGGMVFKGKTKITTQEFAQFLSGGLQAVQEIGGAKLGEKTMVDALAPAARVVSQYRDRPLEKALIHTAEAAKSGAALTREMIAQHGRARFTSERSKGLKDAGATSMALIIEGFLEFFQGKRISVPFDSTKEPFDPPVGRFINHPETMVIEDNQGLALAYPELVSLHEEGILLRTYPKAAGKVSLVIGHGGGHTPSMGGFIGQGLLDADVYGPLFTCASGVRIGRAAALADRGAGVLLLVSNHSGDVLNARLAIRRVRSLGIEIEPIVLSDDIATSPRSEFQDRRGLSGLLFALKIGGASAEEGNDLSQLADLMNKTNERTATLAVAGRSPMHPVSGEPLFWLPDGQIEIGTGVHGEVGVYRGEHLPADQVIDLIIEKLVEDLAVFNTNKMLCFINGAGGTSVMELHILYNRMAQNLSGRGIEIAAGVVGSFFTTLEMGGFSLSLCTVDDEMLYYWDQPASAAYFRWPIK